MAVYKDWLIATRNVLNPETQKGAGALIVLDARTGNRLPLPGVLAGMRLESSSRLLVDQDDLFVYRAFLSAEGRLGTWVNLKTGQSREITLDSYADPAVQRPGLASWRPFALFAGRLAAGGSTPLQTSPGISMTSASLDFATGKLSPLLPEAMKPGQLMAGVSEGNQVYFPQSVRDANAPVTASGLPRSKTDVVELDITSGQWRRLGVDILPKTNGLFAKVQHLMIEGERMYLFGNFSKIGGLQRPGLAVVDRETGRVLDWTPELGGEFLAQAFFTEIATAATPRFVYATGTTELLDDKAVRNLAAVDAATGRVLDWMPSVQGTVTNLVWNAQGLWAQTTQTNAQGVASTDTQWLRPPALPERIAAGQPASRGVVFMEVELAVGANGVLLSVNPSGEFASRPVIIEASTNLIDWTPIATITGPFTFEDTDASRHAYRYYRARQPR